VHKKTAEEDGEVQLMEQKCKLFFSEAAGGKVGRGRWRCAVELHQAQHAR
jgi:hypothetical protein